MIKNLIIYLLLVALPKISYSQAVQVVVEDIAHFNVKDGKLTNKKWVTEQNSFTLENQLIRQIIFNDSLPQVEKYSFFFYSNNSLISKETYNKNDSIEEITKYKYSTDNKLMEENIYKKEALKLMLYETIRFKYSDSLVTEKTTFDNKMNWIEKTTYSKNKEFSTEISTFKKTNNARKLKKQSVNTYFNNSRKEKVLITSEYFNKKQDFQSLIYSYDKKDGMDMERITYLNAAGDTIQIQEFRYDKDRKKVSEAMFDKSGNYLNYLSIERNLRKMNFGKKEMYKF